MTTGLYDYARLDASGEANRAIFRMEARAVDPASEALFEALLGPVVDTWAGDADVLELGAGTGALARRVVQRHASARVHATDLSQEMVAAAARYAEDHPAKARLTFAAAGAEDALGSADHRWDAVLSSVMIPYLQDTAIDSLAARLGVALRTGGVAVFLEQDLATDSLFHPDPALAAKVLGKEARTVGRNHGLGLRAALRRAGLAVEPTVSHLWSTTFFGPYLRDLFGRSVAEGMKTGRLTADEAQRFLGGLAAADAAGDFYYGLVYHRILAKKV
jgi:SAM-dependent methyltransferase